MDWIYKESTVHLLRKFEKYYISKEKITQTRDNRWKKYEAFGEKKVLKDWSEDPRCKVALSTIKYRCKKGLSLEKAITKDKYSF